MKRWFVVLVVSFLIVSGCTDLLITNIGSSSNATVTAKGVKKEQSVGTIEGEIGPGALYRMSIPENWNGGLVLYAHGYVDPSAEGVALPSYADDIQVALNSYGFGVAFSSYSENGWAVKDGVIRTRQLIGIFTSHFGKPQRTYILGHSLGGMVALMLAEKNPGLIDGAMSICSFVGGAPKQIEYIFHVRVLFDFYYPGVIPGTVTDVPEGLDFWGDVAPAALAAMSANPDSALELALVDQVAIPWNTSVELSYSILTALYFNIAGTNDMLDRTHGHVMVDNTETVYTIWGFPIPGQDDPVAGVARYESTPDAEKYIEHYYLPTGKLKVPVMMLHTTRDPQVPYSHQLAYRQIVKETGAEGFLVQRGFKRYGHCTPPITEFETLDSFLKLVAWVEDPGDKPDEWVIP
jgi:pimeloyl-ACP methyl ester carboxylesterase